MAKEDFLAQAKGMIPDFSFLSGMGIWIFGIVLFMMVVGGIITLFYFYQSFNIKIKIFRNIAGYSRLVAVDRGRFVRVSQAGDFILFLKKHKKWLPRPTIQTAPREYWFYIRDDGEYINFGLENIDEVMSKAKVKYIAEDMRMSRLAISEILKKKFEDVGWWQKHGQMVINLALYFVMAMLLFLVFRQFIETAGTLNAILDKADKILQGAHNLEATGILKPTG